MPTISQATRRIRNTRGSSFLTHGGDNYDHRGLNKARRNLSKALIEEYLEAELEEDTPEPIFKWIVIAWCVDGDKSWLDGFECVGQYDTQAEAVEHCQRYEEYYVGAPKWQYPWYEYRELEEWELY